MSSLSNMKLSISIPPSSCSLKSSLESFGELISKSPNSTTIRSILPDWCDEPKRVYRIENIENQESMDLDRKAYLSVGRNPNSEIYFGDLRVSRHHALFLHHVSGELYLVDLDSTHGTFIGSERLVPYQPFLVKNGSLIRFGGSSSKRGFIVRLLPNMKAVYTKCEGISCEEDKQTFLNTHLNSYMSANSSSSSSSSVTSTLMSQEMESESNDGSSVDEKGSNSSGGMGGSIVTNGSRKSGNLKHKNYPFLTGSSNTSHSTSSQSSFYTSSTSSGSQTGIFGFSPDHNSSSSSSSSFLTSQSHMRYREDGGGSFDDEEEEEVDNGETTHQTKQEEEGIMIEEEDDSSSPHYQFITSDSIVSSPVINRSRLGELKLNSSSSSESPNQPPILPRKQNLPPPLCIPPSSSISFSPTNSPTSCVSPFQSFIKEHHPHLLDEGGKYKFGRQETIGEEEDGTLPDTPFFLESNFRSGSKRSVDQWEDTSEFFMEGGLEEEEEEEGDEDAQTPSKPKRVRFSP